MRGIAGCSPFACAIRKRIYNITKETEDKMSSVSKFSVRKRGELIRQQLAGDRPASYRGKERKGQDVQVHSISLVQVLEGL
ncbi:MAG: hypothetical protein COV91_02340 [Candidatus Taylorbacteria bacterium CG11_big_fil_rev_8_21_14_0_20_46_11]|uniref:Uncharacterized protein n=1 Tax=Candidatus Taylorbacteria bacterium CG11_big_fil_rev_8_21_14_0_20_46_11 TaxID=1975025 RepID=A0A2H0KBY7_9BACT|nr:MAG: hypothetical protein COV91_02340 [Candidatus Taylorbacteria bacterium CG11_big_fil_rev_8_21_14_0_20_46_11]